MNHDHPAIQECYAAKAKLCQEFGRDDISFYRHLREKQAAAKKQGVKIVDLSTAAPSAYAKRMTSGPLPKNYWKRKPVRETWDPIADEIKAITAVKRIKRQPQSMSHA